MTNDRLIAQWYVVLEAYAQAALEARPQRDVASLSVEEREQHRIVETSFYKWMRDIMPTVQQSRMVFSWQPNYPRDPFLFLTADPPGVLAMSTLVQAHPRLYLFTRAEWGQLPKQALPPANARVHYWSYFEKPDGQLAQRAQLAHLNVPLREMRVHRTGFLFNENASQEHWHLWRFDGIKYSLLKEDFRQITS